MQQAGRMNSRASGAKAGKGNGKSGKASDKAAKKAELSPQEQALKQREAAEARKAFLGFAMPIAFVSGLLGLIMFFAAGPKLAVALPGAILSLSLSYRYPRQALWFFFLYMPFSGTVTYWLAGGNALFQLAKDAFYFPALLAIWLGTKRDKADFWKPNKLMPWMWLLVVFSIMTLLFVNLPREFLPTCNESTKLLGKACKEGKPFAQGLLGAKVYLGYIPLVFCMQRLIKGQKEFLFFTRSHLTLAIACCGLCLMQYLMLKTGRCAGTDHLSGDDLFKATLSAKCLVGGSLVFSPSQGMIRLPGTFVAPWQWGWFLIANAYITTATAFSDPKALWRLLGMLGMGFVFICAVISGQRVALALVPVSVILLVVLTGQLKSPKRFIPIAVGVGALFVAGTTLYADIIAERIASFQSRWEASPATDMIAHQIDFVWPLIKDAPLGNGLGGSINSTRMFGPTVLIETWFPRVAYETGLIGLIIFLLFVSAISIFTFKAYRSLKEKNLRSFAACFWVFIVFISYQTYYYPLDVDPVAVYYWSMIGVVFRLPAIEKQMREALLAPEAEGGEVEPEPSRFAPVRIAPKRGPGPAPPPPPMRSPQRKPGTERYS